MNIKLPFYCRSLDCREYILDCLGGPFIQSPQGPQQAAGPQGKAGAVPWQQTRPTRTGSPRSEASPGTTSTVSLSMMPPPITQCRGGQDQQDWLETVKSHLHPFIPELQATPEFHPRRRHCVYPPGSPPAADAPSSSGSG